MRYWVAAAGVGVGIAGMVYTVAGSLLIGIALDLVSCALLILAVRMRGRSHPQS